MEALAEHICKRRRINTEEEKVMYVTIVTIIIDALNPVTNVFKSVNERIMIHNQNSSLFPIETYEVRAE